MRAISEFFLWAERQQNLERFRPGKSKLAVLLKARRMEALTALVGNPQRDYRIIHVAGSKGKGSTVSLLAHSFAAHGYRVGAYLSPHVRDYGERFVLLPDSLSALLSERRRVEIATRLRDTLLRHCGDVARPVEHPALGHTPPTTFEILTLYAFLLFRAAGCQWAMIECGLGGLYDSTNVVRPAVTVITSIEREHTRYLGRSLARIARQKAGIIKKGAPLFLFAQKRRVRRAIAKVAARKGAPLFYLPERSEAAFKGGLGWLSPRAHPREAQSATADRPSDTPPSPSGIDSLSQTKLPSEIDLPSQIDSPSSPSGIDSPPLLPSQIDNITAAYIISAYHLPGFSPSRFRDAVPRAQLLGRYQRLRSRPPVYCDGAHTPLSLAAAVENFTAHFGRAGLCVFGCSADKNSRALLRRIRGRFAHYIFTANTAAHDMIDPATLLRRAARLGIPRRDCVALPSTRHSRITQTIIERAVPTLICGSFYIIAPMYEGLVEE